MNPAESFARQAGSPFDKFVCSRVVRRTVLSFADIYWDDSCPACRISEIRLSLLIEERIFLEAKITQVILWMETNQRHSPTWFSQPEIFLQK